MTRTSNIPHGFYFLTAAVAAIEGFGSTLDLPGRAVVLASPLLVVLVHELGHASCALLSGRRVRKMTVTPLWGSTTVTGPRRPNWWIATVLAGPALAAALAGAYLLVSVTGGAPGASLDAALRLVAIVSLVESAGNLLPFGALDGRKIRDELRSRPVPGVIARLVRWARAVRRGAPAGDCDGVEWALDYLNHEMSAHRASPQASRPFPGSTD